jgi:hypothetical protein
LGVGQSHKPDLIVRLQADEVLDVLKSALSAADNSNF